MVAGEKLTGENFNCALISIEEFIEKGGYGNIKMSAEDIEKLKQIFPTGVCSNN